MDKLRKHYLDMKGQIRQALRVIEDTSPVTMTCVLSKETSEGKEFISEIEVSKVYKKEVFIDVKTHLEILRNHIALLLENEIK